MSFWETYTWRYILNSIKLSSKLHWMIPVLQAWLCGIQKIRYCGSAFNLELISLKEIWMKF